MAYRFKARSTTPGDPALKAAALAVVAGYPLEADVQSGVYYGTSGTEFLGEFIAGAGTVPDPSDVREGVEVGYTEGTLVVPSTEDVRVGIGYGAAGTEFTGTYGLARVTHGQILESRTLRQTAVYWPPSTEIDAHGVPILSTPQQIRCRWEYTQEEFIQPDGEKGVSRAKVFLIVDLELGGMLWLGTLEEATAPGFPADPREAGALNIRSVSKMPTLKAEQYVRVVYL